MTVHSPKTAHHDGKGARVVPLFPEIRGPLEQVFEEAETGSVYVITRYRQANINLRTQLERIIAKAGLEPWPKLFQNLRATRETELAKSFPMHVVCDWIGNSKMVAAKHYLQTTEDDFEAAAKAVQIPVQSGAAPARTEIPLPLSTIGFAVVAKVCWGVRFQQWAMQDSNLRHLPCKGSALTN